MRVSCPECESKFNVPDKALGATGRKLRCSKCGHQWFQEPAPEKPPKGKAASGKAASGKAASGKAGEGKSGGKGKPASKTKPKPPPEPAPEPDDDFADPPAEQDPDDDHLRALRTEAEMEPPPLRGLSRFRASRSPERPRRRLPVALMVLAAAALAVPLVLFAGREALVGAWPAMALLYDRTGLHVPVPGEGLVLQNVYVQRRQEGAVQLLVVAGEIHNPGDHLLSLPALRGTVLDAQGAELATWLFAAEVQQLVPGDTGRFQSELAGPPDGAARVNVTFTDERPAAGLGY